MSTMDIFSFELQKNYPVTINSPGVNLFEIIMIGGALIYEDFRICACFKYLYLGFKLCMFEYYFGIHEFNCLFWIKSRIVFHNIFQDNSNISHFLFSILPGMPHWITYLCMKMTKWVQHSQYLTPLAWPQ